MSRATFGKPLKGVGTLSAKFSQPIEDAILDLISTGGTPLESVEISGGIIDGVVIGGNNPGPGYFTTLQSGTPSGQGYMVCFYGQNVGDSACWEPVIGRWNIQGDLLVRDISDLGNIRIAVNTISSTNINGNIILDPNGTGLISIIGPVSQTTTIGNIVFNTTNGLYSLQTGTTITTTSGTDTLVRSSNGDITLQTGLNIPSLSITSITTGSNPIITTSIDHGLVIGDTVDIIGSNSTPTINGSYKVTTVPTTNTFTITPVFTVTSSGNTGTVTQHNDIYLTATNAVNVPLNIPLTFGGDTQNIIGNVFDEITINTGGDINLTPSSTYDINIPNNIGLTFGSDTRKIESDGTNLTVDVGAGNMIINNTQTTINGNLQVNGTTTTVQSTVTTIQDPVITLGGNTVPTLDDNKDRGIEFRWHDGTNAKVGFFGMRDSNTCFSFIPDATNTGEVFTGALGDACFGDTTVNNLTVTGTITGGTTGLSTEHLSGIAGSVLDPTFNINMTFITVTTAGVAATGTLPASISDGFQKFILVTSLVSGASYELTCPTGRLVDPGTGTSVAKKLVFQYVGQSVVIIWDNTENHYIIIGGGACIESIP